MTSSELIAWGTALLTFSGVLVAVTRYIIQQQFHIRIERLQHEKDDALKVCASIDAANRTLLDELNAARRTGAVASAKKAEVDAALTSIVQLTQARAGSLYLPFRADTGRVATGLIFLSIQPLTEDTQKLRRKVVPIHSLAGRCLMTGEPFAVTNAKSSPDHYTKADEVTRSVTQDVINVPLTSHDQVIGVLQLMNRNGSPFSENDIATVRELSPNIIRAVDEFLQIPNSINILGIDSAQEADNATIMCCDLSASSLLYQEMSVPTAVQHINEYLEMVCDIAFRHGATIDKYMGDGAILRFNVPRPVKSHPLAAVQAALQITEKFQALRAEWAVDRKRLAGLRVRIGLAFGPVQKANIGHPQYQYLTVFGPTVNSAVNLCNQGDRDRDLIMIDELLYQHVSGDVEATSMPAGTLGKAGKYTLAAYEVRGLKGTSRRLTA